MSDLIWLSDGAMRRIEPHFPRPHSVPRVDDRRIAGGIKNGLRWRAAPHGLHKVTYTQVEVMH